MYRGFESPPLRSDKTMSYLVLARKYRPQRFAELIGQDHVAATLVNAIDGDKVAHAFIFSGPMGIGKTSAARILAKCLNCERGRSSVPCNECSNCVEIAAGSSLDVMEIDGASSRGIDEIRSLRDNSKFAPSKSRYKIYIIDEVHMLTKEAFNALLKTLEEPPSHVVFVFATTEVNKIPNTIRSRCQHFAFHRISRTVIVDTLRKIAKREGIEASEDALFLIAKAANGSLRDSQSIFDQAIGFGGGAVKAEDVRALLGFRDDGYYLTFLQALLAGKTADVLAMSHDIVTGGGDVRQFLLGTIEYLHAMLLLKQGVDEELLEMVPEQIKSLREMVADVQPQILLKIHDEMMRTVERLKMSSVPRADFEIMLVKVTEPGFFVTKEELFARVLELGRQLREGAPPAVVAAESPSGQRNQTAPLDDDSFYQDNARQIDYYQEIAKAVMAEDRVIGNVFIHGYPRFERDRLEVRYSANEAEMYTIASDAENIEKLSRCLETVTGRRLAVEVVLSEEDIVDERRERRNKLIHYAKDLFKADIVSPADGGGLL